MVNEEKTPLDCASYIANGRTYLPLRFIAENLNAKVEWISKEEKVIITKQ